MTKTLSVYLNANEHKLLTALQEKLGFSEESKVVKAGLVSLANGRSEEPNGELRVEIPISMQLEGIIRKEIVRRRAELKEEAEQRAREKAEAKSRVDFVNTMMQIVRYEA